MGSRPHIAFLHTAEVHVATFDRLLSEAGAEVMVTHDVAPHLLQKARDHGVASVETETLRRLADFPPADLVICTCTTLGPLVGRIERDSPPILRVDGPMMAEAVRLGGTSLVALCLESTEGPTLDLFQTTAQRLNLPTVPELLHCFHAWPLFESGDLDAFGQAIALAVEDRLDGRADIRSVVLAQASMRAALPYLSHLDVPVLTSPDLAVRHALSCLGILD